MLPILLKLQPLFIPSLIILTGWATVVTVFKKDSAVGLVFYVSLIIIVDSYLNTGIYIPGFEYGSIRYSEALLVFLFVGAPKKTARSGVHRLLAVLMGLYFILLFYSALRGLTLIDGLNNFRRFMVPQFLTLWIAQRGFRKAEDYQRFFSFMIVLLILIGLFTFWDVFFDRILLKSASINSPEYYVNRKNGRFGSFFLNPIDLGDFTVLLLPIMLLVARVQRALPRRIILWAGLMLFAFAFVKTQSRGPMIGCLVSVILFALLPYKKFPLRRRIASILMMVLLLSVFLPGFYETATRRFANIEQETSLNDVSRRSTWDHVIDKLILPHPLFGIGLGEAKFIRSMHETGFVDEFGSTLDNPHNSYLEIALAAGFPAALIFVVVNLLVIGTNISFMRRNVEEERSLLLLGLTSGIGGFLIATITGQDMFRISVAPVYWLMVGLCISITSAAPKPIRPIARLTKPTPLTGSSAGAFRTAPRGLGQSRG